MNLPAKKHTLISIGLFCVIFAGLLITATFTDFQVSQILTKGTLMPGKYYADGLFGVVFECLGCTAPYIMGSFSLSILLIYSFRFIKNPKGRFFSTAGMFLLVCATNIAVMLDVLDYNIRHYGLDGKPDFMKAELIIVGIFTAFVEILAVNNFSDASIRKLVKFTFAVAFAIAVSSITVTLIKYPFGRPRYRAMNYAGDFSYYQRWYVMSGQPDKEWLRETFTTSDAFKSFPSGHTQSAAMVFCIVMLKDALGIINKKRIAMLWIFSVVWTGIIAISRIMVGAHFFSDVLIGGTIGFLCVILGREIFICKGSHIKSLKAKGEEIK